MREIKLILVSLNLLAAKKNQRSD